MEISISTGAFYKKSIDNILNVIRQTSCNNIELCLNSACVGVAFDDILRMVNQNNLTVKSIHLPFSNVIYQMDETEENWIIRCIEYAKMSGCNILTTHSVEVYPNGIAQNCDEQHKYNIKTYGQSDNIFVTTENISTIKPYSFLCSTKELSGFLKECNQFMTFDTTHIGANNESLIDSYILLKEHVKNIHISDFANGEEHKILGTGLLDLPAFLSYLYKENYEGLLTIELDFDNEKRNLILSEKDAVIGLQKSIDFITQYYC